jgi:chaperone modulatory protein CbpM
MKISKQDFLALSGLEHETLNAWLAEQWLIPSESSGEASFSDIDVARAQLIRDLKEELGVNDEGVGVILNLLDQLYGIRRALIDLHRAVGSQSDGSALR